MNDNIPNNLSRTLLRFRGISLRLVVRLKNEDGKLFHNEYEFKEKRYVRLDPSVYLLLELDKIDDVYDPTRGIVIGQGNIHIFIRNMKDMIKNIYEKNVFAMRNNEVILYSDVAKECMKIIKPPRSSSSLALIPTVTYDENEVSYEGVRLLLNRTDNAMDLTIDEFEALVYTIEKTDLFSYSQSLINYISANYKYSNEIEPTNISYNKNKNNRIDWVNNGTMNANFRKGDSDDVMSSLSDINKNKL